MRMTTINLKLKLNKDQLKLLRLFAYYYSKRTDEDAAKLLFHHGLNHFAGLSTGDPALPGLEEINMDRI